MTRVEYQKVLGPLNERVKMTEESDSKQVEEEKACLRESLKDQVIRSVLWRILNESGLYGDCLEPTQAMRFLGRRSIGLWLSEEIDDADENALALMQRENK